MLLKLLILGRMRPTAVGQSLLYVQCFKMLYVFRQVEISEAAENPRHATCIGSASIFNDYRCCAHEVVARYGRVYAPQMPKQSQAEQLVRTSA